MDAHTLVLWNGAKTETFAPQNDHAMERNINFLLTATVAWLKPCPKYPPKIHIWVPEVWQGQGINIQAKVITVEGT